MSNEDVVSLLKYVPRDREIEVYVDNDVSLVEKRMMEVSLGKGNGVLIEENVEKMIDDPPWSSECINEKRQQRWSDEFQFIKLLFEIDHDDDDLVQLVNPVVWQKDNYHGDREEEETTHLFVELDHGDVFLPYFFPFN
ncbi:hypothetical protein Tco_0319598 [Tanacetum coccineum]